jgi:hypothetical protein
VFAFWCFGPVFHPLFDFLVSENFEKFLEVDSQQGFMGLVWAVGCLGDKEEVGDHVQEKAVVGDDGVYTFLVL